VAGGDRRHGDRRGVGRTGDLAGHDLTRSKPGGTRNRSRQPGVDGVSGRTGRNQPRRRIVNWDQIEGNWKQFKGKAKEQWGKLTDDDLDKVEGRRDQLAGRIQERYGVAKDEADRQIGEWERTTH
jgi:uncharacterized protein YjbJ (UPF0337 family)